MDPIPHENAPVTDRYLTYEQMNLINSFRTSSLEMAIFSRFVASCIIIYGDCFDALFARLLQVPAEIFQEWVTYMGRDTAEKYYNLLTQHIIIMVELLQAIKAGNQQEADRLLTNWYKNADETKAWKSLIICGTIPSHRGYGGPGLHAAAADSTASDDSARECRNS